MAPLTRTQLAFVLGVLRQGTLALGTLGDDYKCVNVEASGPFQAYSVRLACVGTGDAATVKLQWYKGTTCTTDTACNADCDVASAFTGGDVAHDSPYVRTDSDAPMGGSTLACGNAACADDQVYESPGMNSCVGGMAATEATPVPTVVAPGSTDDTPAPTAAAGSAIEATPVPTPAPTAVTGTNNAGAVPANNATTGANNAAATNATNNATGTTLASAGTTQAPSGVASGAYESVQFVKTTASALTLVLLMPALC